MSTPDAALHVNLGAPLFAFATHIKQVYEDGSPGHACAILALTTPALVSLLPKGALDKMAESECCGNEGCKQCGISRDVARAVLAYRNAMVKTEIVEYPDGHPSGSAIDQFKPRF